MKNKRHTDNLRLLVLCVFLAIMLQFFLEPVFIGMPWMFCMFCFYGGILKSINAENAISDVFEEVEGNV
jgi:hypothetical protein